jgi:hypothetical protein
VKIAEREGAQNTPAVWAFVNVTPRRASLSILGVTACPYPSGPTQSQRSSKAKNKTLGLLGERRLPASNGRHPATDNDPTHNSLKNLRLDQHSIAITTPCPTDDVNTPGYRPTKNTHIVPQ